MPDLFEQHSSEVIAENTAVLVMHKNAAAGGRAVAAKPVGGLRVTHRGLESIYFVTWEFETPQKYAGGEGLKISDYVWLKVPDYGGN